MLPTISNWSVSAPDRWATAPKAASASAQAAGARAAICFSEQDLGIERRDLLKEKEGPGRMENTEGNLKGVGVAERKEREANGQAGLYLPQSSSTSTPLLFLCCSQINDANPH